MYTFIYIKLKRLSQTVANLLMMMDQLVGKNKLGIW